MKKFLKALMICGIAIGGIILAAALGFCALTLFEYKPADTESVTPPDGTRTVKLGEELTVLSYNIGYAALSETEDFFMDGGEKTMPDNKELVENNLKGILSELTKAKADIYMLQEVDTDSKRSFRINEVEYLAEGLGLPYDFAYNFYSVYTPYPLPDTIGTVHSGLCVYTDLKVAEAERIQLPIPFDWPVRCFNLKRCLLINRMPIEGSDKEFVFIDLHLEAYDDGEGKIEQTKMLYELLKAEYSKGNYVVCGGDFNQIFPGSQTYMLLDPDYWTPGQLENDLPEGYKFVFSGDRPTCRLLNVPYKGNDEPQYYIIDGFIVSSNISVDEFNVVETNFVYSDHQPVLMKITLN